MVNLKFFQKLLLLLLFNCCSNIIFAQRPAVYKTRDSIIEKSVNSLHQQGIDTIAVYSQYSSMALLPNCRSDQFPNYDPNKYDPCSWQDTFLVFILWKMNGKSYFTFKSQCYDYPVKPLADNSLWHYYLTSRITIENNKPKEPLLKHVNLQTEEVTIGPDKMSYHENENNQMIILIGKNKTIKNIGYRLYQQFGNWGDQNLNYDYNMKLPVKQLQLKLEALCRPMVVSRELIPVTKQ